MFFANFLRAKLVSHLRPWLEQDPDAELNLGFLKSIVSLKNLSLKPSALNPSIKNSTTLAFKKVMIGELSLRISPWSFPSLILEVRGVDVTLIPRESVDDRRVQRDSAARKRKNIIAALDPEGVSLHEIVERILVSASSGSQFMTTLMNGMLRCCQIQFTDINMQLQFIDDSYACMLKVNDLCLKPQLVDQRSLFIVLVGLLNITGKETLLAISCNCVEFGLQETGYVKWATSLMGLSACVKLNNLQPLDYLVRIPRIEANISPEIIPILLVLLDIISFKEIESDRSGQELWKIAAEKTRPWSLTTKPSIYKIANIVLLWLRYVRGYESLLWMIGYHANKTQQENLGMVLNYRKHLSLVKHQWESVGQLEEKLPAEAVARARQIARHRALSRLDPPELESNIDFITSLLSKIVALLLLVWKGLRLMYLSAVHLSFMGNAFSAHRGVYSFAMLNDVPQIQFSLFFGEVQITLSHANTDATVYGKVGSEAIRPDMKFMSFCFIFTCVCLDYATNITDTTFFVSLGELKCLSSLLTTSLKRSNKRGSRTPSFRGFKRKAGDESYRIIWCDPAFLYHPSDDVFASSSNTADSAFGFIFENNIRDLWSNWKMISRKCEEMNFKEQPGALFELKNLLMDPNSKQVGCGLWKCCLALGKLNVDLEHSSMLSIALLFKQLQHYQQLATTIGRTHAVSHPLNVLEENFHVKRKQRSEFCLHRMKIAIFNTIPYRNIVIGALIGGPNIRISLQDKLLDASEQDFGLLITQGSYRYCFTFDIKNIEFAVVPTYKAVLTRLHRDLSFDEAALEGLLLKVPQKVDIPELHTNDSFVCQGRMTFDVSVKLSGMTVVVNDFEVNLPSPILEPTSVKLQCSTCRDYRHSLVVPVNILSMALSASTTGISVFFYMDEICSFFQILEDILSVVLSTFNSLDSATLGYSQTFVMKLRSFARRNTERTMVDSEVITETMIFKNTQILLDATFELEAMDIILDDSRKKLSGEASVNSDGASSSTTDHLFVSSTRKKSKSVEILGLPVNGIGLFTKRSDFHISVEGNHLDILMNLSGFQSLIFSGHNVPEVFTGSSVTSHVRNLLEQSSEYLCQCDVSKCSFSIHIDADGSNSHNPDCGHALEACHLLTARIPETASDCWIFVDIQLGPVFLSSCCMKRSRGSHQPNKLEISIYICRELHTINCNIQGGDIFLESSTLAMFAHCFQAYFHLISERFTSILTDSGKPLTENQLITEKPNNFSREDYAAGSFHTASLSSETEVEFHWVFLQDFTVHLSQFSVTLVGKEGSELELELDTRLKWQYSGRKLLFDLNQLTIFTQQQHKCIPYKSKDPVMPHFLPSNTLPSQIKCGNYEFPSQGTESIPAGLDVQSKKSLAFPYEDLVDNDTSKVVNEISYVLKHMAASIMIKKMHLANELCLVPFLSNWVGNGSISGVDLTINISEIQMISSILEPLFGISGGKKSQEMNQSFGSSIQEWNHVVDHKIPDGAIVVIKDLHEHMYFAAETTNNKYHVIGVLHYTLVSERALFRVKYHKGWRSQVSGISLTSLFAKNKHGEPLRLNFSPGSGFVELSSCDDNKPSLWQTFPSKCKCFEDDDDDRNFYGASASKAFYLVNQKNNCGIAFIDGLPEFVKKPGHPFKAKVLDNCSLTIDQRLIVSNESSGITRNSKAQGVSSQVGIEDSGYCSELPYVNITVDKVSLTIFHEYSDVKDKIPILRGSINDFSIIGHITSSKVRVISSFSVTIQYMDARRNLWRDIVSPVGTSLFFQSRFKFLDTGSAHQGMPTHLFFSIRQVEFSLTESSVDVLLYLIGTLNIAGPYAVRNSMIFPNCCKVENHSGLDLLCHFPNKQDLRLAGKQSASVFLRYLSAVDHLPESESTVTVRLSGQGLFSTSPVNVSLSKGCFFAWRTRAVSLHDSRSFPGPFIVVEVSQKSEGGLFLSTSPLLRISNESGFSMELRFRRSHETEGECATILLKSGDTVDDSVAAFDALELSGGSRRALMSLTLGNFLLSVRPEIAKYIENSGDSVLAEWSEDLEGGKALRMSGIFDKLNYRFRKAFGAESVKIFFDTLHCPLLVEGRHFSDFYFLVQTIGRDVPIMQPPNIGDTSVIEISPVALQVQKEIFVYPTVQVYNLLQTEVSVHVTENPPDICMMDYDIGKKATIQCGSSTFLYANPAIMYFTVTLTTCGSKCKPVSSADWLKKLQRHKNKVQYVDTELDFGGGRYALLRLSRADKGFLEVMIYSSYMFQNNTEFSLICSAANQKPLSWDEIQKYGPNLPPELGCLLAPKATGSWFLKSTKVHLKLLEEKASVSLLDLDILTGFTEISLEAPDELGINCVTKLGLSVKPCVQNVHLPSQAVCIVPRYVIANESKEPVFVRQCCLQDDLDIVIPVEGKQRMALQIRKKMSKTQDTSILDSIFKKHINLNENSQVFIQFRPKEDGYSWSGPVCVASLGRFFLKFKRSSATLADKSSPITMEQKKSTEFALIQVVEEFSSLVLHFYLPANVALPYRIENHLRGSPLVYYQKDSIESDTLGSGDSREYVWDDLNLPHKLVIEIVGLHLVREINIDKICSWKPLFEMHKQKGIMHLSWDNRFGLDRTEESHGLEMFKVGFEVYANGPTRVLRICEGADSYEEKKVLQPRNGYRLRVSAFSLCLLEENKQDVDAWGLPIYSTIIVARLANVAVDSIITVQFRYCTIAVQSLNVDEKWHGASFASMVRRSQTYDSDSNENILRVVFILRSTNLNVKEVKYSSIILQPVDLNIDEETLMRLVPFWRTSLSTSRTPSQQFYFKHFEIHPIKITASFLPGNPYSSYSSAQETLRLLLHTVIKVPAVNKKVVELNGILLTHAFVTFRELLIKCAQHYSWYVLRGIYIAKGSQLLPPTFASIFDDTASSSLDVFFDPSDGSVTLPGLTLGMFKFISKSIDSKGFSGTKRYFGDLGKTIRIAGSNALFAAVTEISDSILKGAEASGFNGMVTGFHQGILRLAMEPSLLGAAVLEGGPDRKIKLDRSPGVDELYIEGYLQAMLDVIYKQAYLRVRVIDNQVVLKNLPPNSSVINEIVENVKSFLVSKALLKGDASMASRPLRHLRTESEWRLGPIVLTLCEHLFVSFTIRILRKHADRYTPESRWKWNCKNKGEASSSEGSPPKSSRKLAVGKFIFSGMIAYLDGRLCRHIPNPIARRIVSGFLISYLDNKDGR